MSNQTADDHLSRSVPLSERRGSITMGLLWITMVTCFPNVLAGFQWFKSGMNISQVLFGASLSCLIVLLYSIPACYLGARSGLTYTMLCRFVFGNWGASFISTNVIFVSTGWYALNAIFLADGIRGLFGLELHQVGFAVVIALLMAVNNFFGFSGVANFARFLAAPIMLLWVAIAFLKAVPSCPSSVWLEPAALDHGRSLTIISSFVIGIACWGNEPDYWRFGRPKWTAPVLPLAVALLIGQIVFPLTGWMMARLTGVTEFAQATRLMNDYVFGGLALVAAAVLSINYVAVNDAGLYAAINATENLKKMPRKICVFLLALLAAVFTILLFGYQKNFETVAAISCIILPGATVIMMAEFFLIRLICGRSQDLTRFAAEHELPRWRFAAFVSLLIGCVVAALNAGFLPGFGGAWGVPSLLGWTVGLISYLILRPLELRFFDAVSGAEPDSVLHDAKELHGVGKQ